METSLHVKCFERKLSKDERDRLSKLRTSEGAQSSQNAHCLSLRINLDANGKTCPSN